MRLTILVKQAIARSHFFPSYPLEVIAGMLRFGSWRAQKIPDPSSIRHRIRHELYAFLNREVLGNQPIDYLEFGVYKGVSFKHWVGMNNHPASRFYGFDTFSGLPEVWEHFLDSTPLGAFDVGGELPNIVDSRVEFIKGLFQDTLPGFLERFRLANRLVLNLDADLYSSTLYVLTMAHPILSKGSVLIFDEFASVQHEFRALTDYASAYRREYRVLGWADRFYEHLAIELTK
jgi:hypothetical protein